MTDQTQPTTSDRIAELEAALTAAKEVQRRERKELLDSVTPRMTYTIEPTETKSFIDRIYDPAVKVYRLTGTCTNIAECEAAGHIISTGGMNYLFNTATNRLIMSFGGGHVYIGHGYDADENTEWAYNRIGEFLVRHPEGGDITPIVEETNRHRK
jgi:hypothetical protein